MSAERLDAFASIPLEQMEEAIAVPPWFEEALRTQPQPDLRGRVERIPEPARTAVLHECLRLEAAHRYREAKERVRIAFADLLPMSEVDAAAERPSGPKHPGGSSERLEGQMLGAYQLLEVLGQGGMGVVYRARHARLMRVVALKVIKAGPQASPRDRDRFIAEAEAVARLQHPHIVQVYDVGEQDGRPYLALELVGGGSLAQKLAGTPLPGRQAAELVEVLARAMHHAHQQGVIHRDLKPTNVLLTNDGTPKVTDFGLAKQREAAPGLTGSGEILGTPSYMAPEQAAGQNKDISPAVDIYALGAILYECLTGRPPFKAETPFVTIQQVVRADPVPPRRLQPKVPRDLETICLKCLRKDARQRYGSAAALADDLVRFLQGRPIQARPAGGIERFGRWCKRNPAVAAGAAAVLVLLVAVATISTTAAVRINAHRETAEAAQHAAEIASTASAKDAEAARRALLIADDTLDAALTKFTENEKLRDRGFFELRKELLSVLLPHYEELAALRTEVPELEAARARAYGKMGTVLMYLGETERAIDAWHKSESTFASLIDRNPDVPSYRLSAAICHDELGCLFAEHGNIDQARAALDRGEEIAAALVHDHPESPDHHAIRIRLRLNRRLLELRDEDVLRILREAEQFARTALDRFPNHVECSTLLGQLYSVRGEHLRELQRFADAEQSDREALKALQPFGEMPSATLYYRYWLGYVWFGLGTDLGSQKQHEEACKAYEKAVALFEPLCKEAPNVPSFRKALGRTLFNLAQAKEGIGDAAEASSLRRQSLKVLEELAAGFPRDSGHATSLGINYLAAGSEEFRNGKHDTALEWFTKATTILEHDSTHVPLTPSVQQDLATAHAKRGAALFLLKRYAEAVPAFDRAIALDNGEHRGEWTASRKLAIYKIQQVILPAVTLARSGNHVEAAATASALARGPNAHPVLDFNAACVYAICADKVKDKDTIAAKGYAAEAISLLKHANAAGLFKDPEMLKYLRTDKDLNPLRDHPDFKQIISDAMGEPR